MSEAKEAVVVKPVSSNEPDLKSDISMIDENENKTMKKEIKENKTEEVKITKSEIKIRPKFSAPYFADKEKTQPSVEYGFTGPSDNWFSENNYKNAKSKANFNDAKKHDPYFYSYSSHHIHEEMLKDKSRTLDYQRAIEGNKADFKDKVVLDIGCGTGILSIFAARAGAKHVYAIDNAEIALFAKEIVKKNGFEGKITVLKGKMEELDLPFGDGEIDIIVSEWMGYFLVYESMLDCVIWARDKFLKKGTGLMLPDRAQLYVAAIEDSQYKSEKTNFWNNVYGVNMSVMTGGLFVDPMIDTIKANNIISDTCSILDLDLMTMKKDDVEFSSFYSLKMNYSDKMHALVSWFDVSFSKVKNKVVLSTGPYKQYTHWKQSIFYIDRPLSFTKGDTLYGSICSRRDRTNFRELNIKISYHVEAK